MKEHHGGSDHKKTGHFTWEFEGAGRDSTFWLTKTMPREKRLPKITSEETGFFFSEERRKGVFWLVEWKIIDKGCSKGEYRSVILS